MSFVLFQIPCERKFQIDQHVKTSGHVAKLEKFKSGDKKPQSSLLKCLQSSEKKKKTDEQHVFNEDLCRAMVASNIPLKKLDNENFQRFFQKYCKFNVPSERTLRRNDVGSLYTAVMEEIKAKIGNNNFYLCIDETTDSVGRYIVHLMIGVLHQEILSHSYLIASKQLDKTNNLTVARFVQEELSKFFLPATVPIERVLLMLSDAAPYMVKAGQNLKIFYPKLTHVTCMAHGLNRVAEEIRKKFPYVNKLISTVKKVFLKAPTRVQLYKERLPNTPLPPQPIITRWGTWLKAAIFYADNFSEINDLISELDDDNSHCLLEAKEVLQQKDIKQQLAFIKSNYSFIHETLTKLEKSSLPLLEGITLVEDCKTAFNSVKGKIGEEIFQKFKNILEKNSGYRFLAEISNILMGNFNSKVDLDPETLTSFKNAPITSVDVERSFSVYKYMYTDRRQNFLMENFEQYLIVYCFYNGSGLPS